MAVQGFISGRSADGIIVSATSLTFLDTCSFELSNICGMIQGSRDSGDWVRLTAVPGGPPADHTNMGQCQGNRRLKVTPVYQAPVFYTLQHLTTVG